MFAFLFRKALLSGVGVAFSQQFWYSVRREELQLGSLDAMFGLLQNPLRAFNKDIISKTKILLVIAIISWVTPIASIFVPGALTGQSHF